MSVNWIGWLIVTFISFPYHFFWGDNFFFVMWKPIIIVKCTLHAFQSFHDWLTCVILWLSFWLSCSLELTLNDKCGWWVASSGRVTHFLWLLSLELHNDYLIFFVVCGLLQTNQSKKVLSKQNFNLKSEVIFYFVQTCRLLVMCRGGSCLCNNWFWSTCVSGWWWWVGDKERKKAKSELWRGLSVVCLSVVCLSVVYDCRDLEKVKKSISSGPGPEVGPPWSMLRMLILLDKSTQSLCLSNDCLSKKWYIFCLSIFMV